MTITEKLLKDSHTRKHENSDFIDKVVIDTRKDTHDILMVFVRGMPIGQLVTNKNESLLLSRRLIPETLNQEKEPSEIVAVLESLGKAYLELLIEARKAVKLGSTAELATFFKAMDGHFNDVRSRMLGIVPSGTSRMSAEDAAKASSLQPSGDGR